MVTEDRLKGQQSQEATTVHSGNKYLGDLKEQGGGSSGKSKNCILHSGERECKRPEDGVYYDVKEDGSTHTARPSLRIPALRTAGSDLMGPSTKLVP